MESRPECKELGSWSGSEEVREGGRLCGPPPQPWHPQSSVRPSRDGPAEAQWPGATWWWSVIGLRTQNWPRIPVLLTYQQAYLDRQTHPH